ncbi:CHASE3 domain-containing protein [Allorhizobium sp. BGMRC 0089]|uniref:sensor histidine kinase n=1 Tax=Allorhizobium sonneratiae TaxID=2934936 RepID=UPI0020334304|nr:CHASE3 domain-containing protein [Allorhizobium sonneratiae]MCM2291595.1 CHASE3 domain-containing protein [Allorhizobium sonneratiae]
MPATNRNFVRSSLVMLGLGCLLLLGLIGSSLWMVDKTRTTFNAVVTEQAIRRTSADLMQTLTNAETGQRGFLLTLDTAYLTPYKEAIKEVSAQMEALIAITPPQDERKAEMTGLKNLVHAKLEELAKTIVMANNGEVADALTEVRSGYGKKLMDQNRAILDHIRDISDRKMNEAITRQLAVNTMLTWFGLGVALAILAVVGGAILIVLDHVKDLSRARREVEDLNQGLEERVQERTEDLIQANQEIQRFAYIITHDLRAPLVNIMGFTAELETALKALQTYVLADGKDLSPQDIEDARLAAAEDLPEAIDFIRSSTRKMDGLINAILKISRDGRRQLKPEPFELKEAIEATAASVHHQISDNGGETLIEAGDLTIISDRLSLEQILGNLFDNAIKYKSHDRPLQLGVTATAEGRHFVRIEIADNGRGIAKEDHERIFELFRRSGQQNQVGEGIGLAHVRSLVRNLGGEITVRSELGVGSTFILRFPRDLSKLVRS